MKRLFLDTNAVIDLLGEREPFYESIAKVITLADKKKIKILTSAIGISTAYYILAKYDSTKIALEKIRRFKVLCGISIIDDNVIEKAVNSNFNDFEDAIQYFSAIESRCDVIITRNEKDFKNAMIPVMSAENYLTTI